MKKFFRLENGYKFGKEIREFENGIQAALEE